jgi:hypothetical protein
MRTHVLTACFLSALLISACSLYLRLEIMNAGDNDIEITLDEGWSQHVAPGLSFNARFPGPEEPGKLTVVDGSCHYRYVLPDLDREPWHSLIGDSFKLRWFRDGRMVAYPPTPDVGIPNNPQRASTSDEERTIRPVEVACH